MKYSELEEFTKQANEKRLTDTWPSVNDKIKSILLASPVEMESSAVLQIIRSQDREFSFEPEELEERL